MRFWEDRFSSPTVIRNEDMSTPLLKFVVISESDIFGKEKKKRKRQKAYEGRKIQSFTELSVGGLCGS